MRTEIEVRLRCRLCRAINIATWPMPEGQERPTPPNLDAFSARQVRAFVCKECGGSRGIVVAVYSSDELESGRA